jgi:hypothetical protein
VPATGKAGPLRASDAVALLAYQLDGHRFAVAAYVVTPNIAVPLAPVTLTLQVDKPLQGEVATVRPVARATGRAQVLARTPVGFTIQVPVADDVTWLLFAIQ